MQNKAAQRVKLERQEFQRFAQRRDAEPNKAANRPESQAGTSRVSTIAQRRDAEPKQGRKSPRESTSGRQEFQRFAQRRDAESKQGRQLTRELTPELQVSTACPEESCLAKTRPPVTQRVNAGTSIQNKFLNGNYQVEM
jgi:hypothetical protein